MNPTRERIIADAENLLAFLAADDRLPLDRYAVRISYIVTAASDEEGIAEVKRIASALGVTMTVTGGTHYYATKPLGCITYEAAYILRDELREYQEFMATRPKKSTPDGA